MIRIHIDFHPTPLWQLDPADIGESTNTQIYSKDCRVIFSNTSIHIHGSDVNLSFPRKIVGYFKMEALSR